MWFPHMFNKEDNYNKILPHLPPKDDYLYKSKKPEEKKAFEIWYAKKAMNNFNETLAEYNANDVEILTHALVALRDNFFK